MRPEDGKVKMNSVNRFFGGALTSLRLGELELEEFASEA
jgi:hypothetical protein